MLFRARAGSRSVWGWLGSWRRRRWRERYGGGAPPPPSLGVASSAAVIATATVIRPAGSNSSSTNKSSYSPVDGQKLSLMESISEAEDALKRGKIKEAEDLLESALREKGEVTEGVKYAYDTLASLAYRQGDVRRAESLLLELVDKILKGGVPEDHNSVVGYSLKLARIYAHLGEDHLAELGFRNCVAIQKKKYMKGEKDEETMELWLNSLFWYGMYQMGHDKYDEAKQCFKSAYSMCPEVKTIQPSQVMVLLYNLGEASFSGGEYNEALHHLMNAVVVGRASGSDELASYYTKIGLVYLAKGLGSEARAWCQRGKDKENPSSPAATRCIKEAKRLMQTV